MTNMPQASLSAGQTIDGFVVRRVVPLPDLACVGYDIEHAATGARIVHLHADDSENLFSITFPTPPDDDSGLPHILEHAVLGGSKRFPVKDPFFEMVKCSMATFINAMTSSDHTMYPVASNVKRDFYNLAEVYWDAVFHPTLTRTTFEREGHRVEPATPGDASSDLVVKGIVYNEMKGAWSSPAAVVWRRSFRDLFPDTPYGRESGGDPAAMTALTYEKFLAFHRDLYHPSNALIFLYGDIPTVEHLAFLKDRLAAFDRRAAAPAIPPQPRWVAPRERTVSYNVAPNDPTDRKTFMTINWIVGDGRDATEVAAWEVLEAVLLGNQAAPLRKAIIDSSVGDDLANSGFILFGWESVFSVGVKGSEPDRRDRFVKLVLDTLGDLAQRGIDRSLVDAAFQQATYSVREINSGYPLTLMYRALGGWLYGADPFDHIDAARHLERVRRRFEQDPMLFSGMIRRSLLENPHRLTAVFVPEPGQLARRDAEEAERMSKLKAAMSPAQLEALAESSRRMEEHLNTPNPPEALATLPQLRVADLPRAPRHIPTKVQRLDHAVVLRNAIFANGINHLLVALELNGLDRELIPYLPLYSQVVAKMGAGEDDYVKMARRISSYTGGLSFRHVCGQHLEDPNRILLDGLFSVRFLDGAAEPALAILKDFIFSADPTAKDRLRDVLIQLRASHRTSLAERGMSIAAARAARTLGPAGVVSDLTEGLTQVRLIESIAEADLEPTIQKLEAIRRHMLRRGRLIASFTGSEREYEQVCRAVDGWSGAMPEAFDRPADLLPRETAPDREGLAAPMDVAYCVRVFPAPFLASPDAPTLLVANRLLSYGYLLEEIRFKGTAYGGGSSYQPSSGTMQFYSYRDPHIVRTLEVYELATAWVEAARWDEDDVGRAIIGTAKEGERPYRPGEATGTALARYRVGDTPEKREARHAAMLRVKPDDAKRVLLATLRAGEAKARTCIVSSRRRLESANEEAPALAIAFEDILPRG